MFHTRGGVIVMSSGRSAAQATTPSPWIRPPTDQRSGKGRRRAPPGGKAGRSRRNVPRVAEALSAAGFGDEDVRGIMGENWLRFFAGALAGCRSGS
jgi:hypothetical protein